MSNFKFLLLLPLFALLLVSLGVYSLAEKQIPASFFGGVELSSPSDWVKEDQIKVYGNRIVIDVKNATWAGFTDTNSMDPFIDEDSNAIQIKPDDPNLIDVGDVISYATRNGVIIHRVIEKGTDEEGLYYIVKGDNNKVSDPFKVRYEDVKGVVVAVIY